MGIEFYHHPQSPPSGGVRMLLQELGLDVNEHVIDFFTGQEKSAEYKAINPYMQLPTLKDGNTIFYESRAIAIYLCAKYDKSKKLYPSDIVEVARMNGLLYRDVDNFNAMLLLSNAGEVLAGKACGPLENMLPMRRAVLCEYDARVAEHNYMFGDHLTILDMFVTATMVEIALAGFTQWEEYPNLQKWIGRMEALPYFEEVIAKPMNTSIGMYKAACERNAGTNAKQ